MPTYRTQVNTGADALVSIQTATTPGTVVAGDVGVFWLARWDGTSFPAVTPPAGAVLRGTIASGNIQTQCYVITHAAQSSYVFSWTGARWSTLEVHWFSGVDPALDYTTVPFQSATGTSAAPSTLTVTTVNTAALSWHCNTLDYPSTTTHVPPTGFTETSDFDGNDAAYAISSVSGSLAASGATISQSQLWGVGLVALAPASGGGGTTPSDTDTGAGTETQSVAATSSDTDTGTGSESQSLAVTNSDSDSSAGTEAQSLAVTLSDVDIGTGIETHSIAATSSDTDTSSGAEDVPIIGISDSDVGTGADTEGIVQGANDVESTGGSDTESTSATLPDSDTGTETESHSLAVTLSDSDTSSIADTESSVQGTSDLDTNSGSDSQSIAATLSDSDSSTGTDSESSTATTPDVDTSSGAETYTLAVQVSDSDTSNVTDSATATITSSSTPTDQETPTGSESWSIQIFRAPVGERSLVLGPATLYLAPFGAVEPAMSTVSAAPDPLVWSDLGGTVGGVDLTVEQEWITVDLKQLPDQPMRRLKKRRLTIKTSLAEPTLVNLGYVLNDTTSGSAGVNWASYAPAVRTEASQLSYTALIVDGWKPGYQPGGQHKRRRLIVRKCLSIDNVEFGYTKDGQTIYTVTWSCHYVDAATPPFRVVDAS